MCVTSVKVQAGHDADLSIGMVFGASQKYVEDTDVEISEFRVEAGERCWDEAEQLDAASGTWYTQGEIVTLTIELL